MIKPKFPTVTPLDSKLWRVEDTVIAEFDGEAFPRVVVPAGEVTDGASVPRAFWWFAPKMSPMYLAAAIVHDHLYGNKGRGNGFVMTREEADDLFLESMLWLGMRRWRARIMYRAVRAFGPRW